jgi:flagellar biogenesis protein FliO
LNIYMKKASICCLTAFIWFFYYDYAWAEGDLPQSVAALPSMGSMLFRMLISLGIVVILAVILIRFLQKSTQLTKQSSWARVLDQMIIHPQKRLVLVEMFGKVYVLGVAENNITIILEEKDIDLSQVKELDEMNDRMNMTPLAGSKFLQIFEDKIGQLKKFSSK